MNRLRALLFLLLALLAAEGAPAKQRMQVALASETPAVAPGGTVDLAFVMRPERGWHGYWRNPGDAGAEPRVTWRLPAGWQAGPLQFPVPDRLRLLGLMNYAYERDYALLAALRAPADAAPGSVVPVRVRLEYLVCSDQLCIPETADLAAELRDRHAGPARRRLRFLAPGAAAAADGGREIRGREWTPAPGRSAAGDDRRRRPLFLSGHARCPRPWRGAERLAQAATC